MLRVENVLVDLCDACLDHDGPPLENRVGGLAVFPAVHVGLFVADPLESQGENRFAPMSLASDVGFNLYVYAGSDPINNVDPLGLVVYNDSSRTIWVKPESGPRAAQAIPIPPGGTWPGDQDGISDPGTHPGQVYKNVTGVDLRVNEDGSVDWSLDLSGLINWVRQFCGQIAIGGWKDKDWLEELHKRKPNPDYGWDKLFNSPNQSSETSSNKDNK